MQKKKIIKSYYYAQQKCRTISESYSTEMIKDLCVVLYSGMFCLGDNISLEVFPMYPHFAAIISLAQSSPCPGYKSKQCDEADFLYIPCTLKMVFWNKTTCLI